MGPKKNSWSKHKYKNGKITKQSKAISISIEAEAKDPKQVSCKGRSLAQVGDHQPVGDAPPDAERHKQTESPEACGCSVQSAETIGKLKKGAPM